MGFLFLPMAWLAGPYAWLWHYWGSGLVQVVLSRICFITDLYPISGRRQALASRSPCRRLISRTSIARTLPARSAKTGPLHCTCRTYVSMEEQSHWFFSFFMIFTGAAVARLGGVVHPPAVCWLPTLYWALLLGPLRLWNTSSDTRASLRHLPYRHHLPAVSARAGYAAQPPSCICCEKRHWWPHWQLSTIFLRCGLSASV